MDRPDSDSEPGVILANKTADVCLRSFLFVHPWSGLSALGML